VDRDRARSWGTLSDVTDPFRCSAASAADGEAIAGTAPADRTWLFVEHRGPWGRKALTDSRLPSDVTRLLGSLDRVRVQLMRRPPGAPRADGVRVFTALAGPRGAQLETTHLDRIEEMGDLDLAALEQGRSAGLTPHDAPLWLVCTNGRRDVCCAERGRPVVERLARLRPEETWETTHLGGHRFAATVLALPWGVALGRLDPASAARAVDELSAGRWPHGLARGRVGVPAAAQVAEQRLREDLRLDGIDDVEVGTVTTADGRSDVRLRGPTSTWQAHVPGGPGPQRRQSCADEHTKPTEVFGPVELVPTEV
jgi:hypothetical protein